MVKLGVVVVQVVGGWNLYYPMDVEELDRSPAQQQQELEAEKKGELQCGALQTSFLVGRGSWVKLGVLSSLPKCLLA